MFLLFSSSFLADQVNASFVFMKSMLVLSEHTRRSTPWCAQADVELRHYDTGCHFVSDAILRDRVEATAGATCWLNPHEPERRRCGKRCQSQEQIKTHHFLCICRKEILHQYQRETDSHTSLEGKNQFQSPLSESILLYFFWTKCVKSSERQLQKDYLLWSQNPPFCN